MINSNSNPRVGVAVFIFRDGKFLMCKRKGSHGEGSWSLPGGHLEYGESFMDTARRETLEETGVSVENIRFGAVTNDIFESENKHYVTVWMLSDYSSGEPTILEPHKCTDQAWFDFNSLPEPLFLPWKQLLASEFVEGIKKELNY
ncbi:MAG: hypothetical protein RLY66_269 [Candidatus Parcubacteria bacterium]|jgi:8-oxo-dGTP diphosphatase